MKRIISLILILTLALSLSVACGGNDKSADDANQGVEEDSEANESIKVDKKLMNVEITMPKDYLEIVQIDEIDLKDADSEEVYDTIIFPRRIGGGIGKIF